ncbi:MAG: ComF family protein [Ferrovibrio sp.]|uniref:ComF family protein n=1 Tax=Ferrovibrio sp. TaxID=1917215 RepID=UPI00260F6811|nr:ComF family protein [Ferrovibrio sp.]MCW0233468.1 ComF family protein [Ferrovibrio sp.]
MLGSHDSFVLHGLRHGWRRIWRGGVDALLPPQCMLCTVQVDEPGRLCLNCWPSVNFIAAPCCPVCGIPYAVPVPDALVCGACLKQPPPFARARAAFIYGGGGRDLVLRFKRGDRTDLAPGLAMLMRNAGAALLADCDVILPVPLHRWRLWRRRFNQSALLAQALGRIADRPVRLDLLERPRPTRSLGRLNRTARQRELAGAIRVAAGRAEEVRGRRLLLVDDVFTTGATVNACCRALRRAGAAEVTVLTLARVVRAEQGAI